MVAPTIKSEVKFTSLFLLQDLGFVELNAVCCQLFLQ